MLPALPLLAETLFREAGIEISKSGILVQKRTRKRDPSVHKASPAFSAPLMLCKEGPGGKSSFCKGLAPSFTPFSHPSPPSPIHSPSYKAGHNLVTLDPIEPGGADSMMDGAFSI